MYFKIIFTFYLVIIKYLLSLSKKLIIHLKIIQIMPKEKTKAVTISLTAQEEKDLIQVSEKFFGKSNKSGMVRYWIKKAKD
jgi:hypothetical protein